MNDNRAIVVRSHFISGVNAVNHLVAFTTKEEREKRSSFVLSRTPHGRMFYISKYHVFIHLPCEWTNKAMQ
jgi:hypothetical protein